jgi:hypothetical protein
MDLDRIATLIRARCPELEDDMAEIADRLSARTVALSDEVAERILDVVEALEDKFDALVERVEAERMAKDTEAAFIDGPDRGAWN